MEGGGKQGQDIHDSIKKKLETEFGYNKEEAKAVKSLLYDMAKEKISDDTQGKNLLRAKEMEKMLNKTTLKKITDSMIEARIKLIASQKKQNGVRVASKRRSSSKMTKKASKKSSKRVVKKSSKKSSKRKA